MRQEKKGYAKQPCYPVSSMAFSHVVAVKTKNKNQKTQIKNRKQNGPNRNFYLKRKNIEG